MVSRTSLPANLYRYYPEGKQQLFETIITHELANALDTLIRERFRALLLPLDAQATTVPRRPSCWTSGSSIDSRSSSCSTAPTVPASPTTGHGSRGCSSNSPSNAYAPTAPSPTGPHATCCKATADWIAVPLRFMDWRADRGLAADLTVVVLIGAVLVPLIQEAIPEELWFRGHLYDTLSRSLGTAAVVVLTSVVFGALHIASDPPEGLVERLLYAVMATAFGHLLVSGRHLTGSLWLPIGLHAGHNAFMHGLVDESGSHSQLLLVRTATMTAYAIALLVIWRPSRRLRSDVASRRAAS